MKSFSDFIKSKKPDRASRLSWGSGDVEFSKKPDRASRLSWGSGDVEFSKKNQEKPDRASRLSWGSGDVEISKPKPKLDESFDKEETDFNNLPEEHLKTTELTPAQLNHFRKHRKTFNNSHVDQLHAYKSGGAAEDLNLRMRQNKGIAKGNSWQSSKVHQKNLMRHITSQPLKHHTVVYRGFGYDFNHNKLKPGTVFRDHGFTGTSFDPEIANEFAGYDNNHNKQSFRVNNGHKTIAKIHLPPGIKGHYLDLPGHKHTYDNEKEFLLHHGTKFRVSHHTRGITNTGRVIRVVHLHPIEQPKHVKTFKQKVGSMDPRVGLESKPRKIIVPKQPKKIYPRLD